MCFGDHKLRHASTSCRHGPSLASAAPWICSRAWARLRRVVQVEVVVDDNVEVVAHQHAQHVQEPRVHAVVGQRAVAPAIAAYVARGLLLWRHTAAVSRAHRKPLQEPCDGKAAAAWLASALRACEHGHSLRMLSTLERGACSMEAGACRMAVGRLWHADQVPAAYNVWPMYEHHAQ